MRNWKVRLGLVLLACVIAATAVPVILYAVASAMLMRTSAFEGLEELADHYQTLWTAFTDQWRADEPEDDIGG